MRLHPLRPMLLCLALLVASGHAMANESRQSESQVADRGAPPRQTQSATPAVSGSPRATGGTRTNPPRFHSFLPGMFR